MSVSSWRPHPITILQMLQVSNVVPSTSWEKQWDSWRDWNMDSLVNNKQTTAAGITAQWTTNTVRSFCVAHPFKLSAESASEDTAWNFASGAHVGQFWWNLLYQDSTKRMKTFKKPRNHARWYYKHNHSCISKRQSWKRLSLWCDTRSHRKAFCEFLHLFSHYFYCNCGLNYF